MRGRLLAIAIALAVLAIAGIRHDERQPPPQRGVASSHVGSLPAPAPDEPATITARANTPVTVQTVLHLASSRPLRPAFTVSSVSHRLPVAVRATGKPRVFPLLI